MPYKNKEDEKDRNKQYYKDNKEKIKQHQKNNPGYNKKYFKTEKGKFASCKMSAKIRGLIFGITFGEFVKIVNTPCHYCGGEGYGIDRLDNTIGYLKDNIVSCCSMCNYMKQKYTEENFIEKCIKISNNWRKRKEK